MWTREISEEVYDMGSYHTRLAPRAIRAHIVHFFTYPTRPSCGIHYYYSLEHPVCCLWLSEFLEGSNFVY